MLLVLWRSPGSVPHQRHGVLSSHREHVTYTAYPVRNPTRNRTTFQKELLEGVARTSHEAALSAQAAVCMLHMLRTHIDFAAFRVERVAVLDHQHDVLVHVLHTSCLLYTSPSPRD